MPNLFKNVDLDKKLDFREQIEFAESGNPGEFEGILVKYNNKKLAHGIFRFSPDSLKVNDGKTLFMLYQHNGEMIPVGTMTGKSESDGFKVLAKFDLDLLENGNPINQEAYRLYNLMKNKKAKFDLSVGGYITVREIVDKDNERFVNIKEFDAYEGSIVMRGAVEGSKITKVFNEDSDNKEKMEDNKMDKAEFMLWFAEAFANMKKELFAAGTEEEIKKLKENFAEFKKTVEGAPEGVSKEFFTEQMESINTVIVSLKQNYSKENPTEFGVMEELYTIFKQVEKTQSKAELEFGVAYQVDPAVKAGIKGLNFASTTVSIPDAIKPTYVTKILERLQAANPVLAELIFLPITDNSLKLSREELGLPTTGIVGESDERVETTGVTLDNVTLELWQWYVLPVVSNKLLATNYVGYLPFLIKRAEYALALNMSNKVFNGSGTNQPLGILNDTNVTQTVDFKLQTGGVDLTGSVFAAKIKTIYYTLRSEVAAVSKWYMRRLTWAYITNLKDTDGAFYIGDLTRAAERTLMGRPVILVEDENSGLADIATGNGDNIMVFGDIKNGMLAIQNNKMTISLEDKLTTKGFTKYWMEKGADFGVQLPENFVIVTNTTD